MTGDHRARVNNFHFCEYAVDANDLPELTTLTSGVKCIWAVRSSNFSLFSSSEAYCVCSLNPVLTMRFAVSLKRSADPEGEEEWRVGHFSTARFASRHLSDSEVSGDRVDIEADIPDTLDDQVQTREV